MNPDDLLVRPRYYFSPKIDPTGMNESIKDAFKGRRDRTFPPSAGHERMAVLRRFGYRGVLWDTLIDFSDCSGRKRRGREG